MALFRVSNERAQFDAAGNEASDQYGAGIRFDANGDARVTTGSATHYNQGIPMSSTGQVAIVDATAGLPAGTIFHNGLPISADKVCVSRNATAVVSNGLPYDAAGAVAADVNLDLNFIGTDTLNSSITFTRASTATQFDSSGNLVFAPNNAIRNNTMVGAVAGTPGTLPTNWVVASSGLTQTIVGTGTSAGVNYIDIRVNGTTTGAGGVQIKPDGNAGVIAATASQSWAFSGWVAIVGGSTANLTGQRLYINEYSAGPTYLRTSLVASNILAAGATFTRVSGAITTGASTTIIEPLFALEANSGAAIDITLRIGMPQLERGSVATAVNATSGTAYNGPRFDYDPATLAARGLLIEEQRTNSIRNNTMQGAVAGTPGTLPTNWSVATGGLTGITQQIVGTGTESGITYLDIRFSGTPSGAGTYRIYTEGTVTIAALTGQTWSNSQYLKLAAGTLTGVTGFTDVYQEFTSAGVFVTEVGVVISSPTTSALATQRSTTSRTLAGGATVAFVRSGLQLSLSGAAIDITLRIGLPQLEQGAFATSVIPTTTTALTRSADVASVNTLSPWYNATAGTTYFEGVTFDTTTGGFPLAYQFNDGTSNNRIQITRNTSTSAARMAVITGGVAQAAADATTWTLNATTKAALAYATNDFAIVANGGAATTDTSGTVPTVTNLLLGSQVGGGGQLNGYLRRITYYPRRLSNAELQAITV